VLLFLNINPYWKQYSSPQSTPSTQRILKGKIFLPVAAKHNFFKRFPFGITCLSVLCELCGEL
jgi:hypothetical protein